jgi:hypothetical protein
VYWLMGGLEAFAGVVHGIPEVPEQIGHVDVRPT